MSRIDAAVFGDGEPAIRTGVILALVTFVLVLLSVFVNPAIVDGFAVVAIVTAIFSLLCLSMGSAPLVDEGGNPVE